MSKLWNSIKSKVDQSATSMQEGDWAAMESLLDASPATAPNRQRRWGLFSVLILGVMGLSALLAQPWSHTKPASEVISSEKIVPIEVENPAANSSLSSISKENVQSQDEDLSTTSSKDDAPLESSSSTEALVVGENTPQMAVPADTRNESGVGNEKVEQHTGVEGEGSSDPTHDLVSTEAPVVLNASLESDHEDRRTERETTIELNGKSWMYDGSNELSTEALRPTVQFTEEAPSIADSIEVEPEEQSDSESSASPIVQSSSSKNTGLYVEGHYAFSPALNSGLLSNELGLEVGYNWKGWTFQTGAHYVNTNGFVTTDFTEDVLVYDTTTTTSFEHGVDTSVVKYWVITGYYTGEYRYDTTYTNYTDTIYTVNIDSVRNTEHRTKRSAITTSYVQIPILAGYEWRSGPWGVRLQGGVNVRSLTYISDEFESTTSWGMDAVIRPAISYHWNSKWNVFLRTSLKMPVTSDPLLNRNNFTRVSLGIGVGYRF